MACLIVTEGPSVGHHLDLEQHNLIMIGRDTDCTFQILDDEISRHHLQLRANSRSDNHFAIDFKSANGVYVNEKRIEKETELKDGDVIRIGTTAFVYMTDRTRIAESMREMAKKAGQRFKPAVAKPRRGE